MDSFGYERNSFCYDLNHYYSIGGQVQFFKWHSIFNLLRQKRIILVLFCFIFWAVFIYSANSQPVVSVEENPQYKISDIGMITASDRILIFAPHPDDEAIGCGGIIQEALGAGADIHIVYLTNGDNNQLAFIVYEKRLTFRKGEFLYMGEVRRKEAIAAMALLGVRQENLIFLGYPDFGTFSIFRYFWQADKPYKSLSTRVSHVPYKTALSFGASYDGESILRDLKNILKKYKPNKIFVSHPIDTNSDHKTMYLFLGIALADLRKDFSPPEVYSYLIHFKGWPLPRRYHPELELLPPKEFTGSKTRWFRHELSPQSLERKYNAILCYKSQTQSSAFYLLSFARKNELFGVYPDINADFFDADFKKSKVKQDFLKERIRLPFGLEELFSGIKSVKDSGYARVVKNNCHLDYGVESGYFLIRIDKQEDINNNLGGIIYIFGYNYKIPFRQMPKVRIITKYRRVKIFHGRKLIKQDNVVLDLQSKEAVLRIPLVLLGDPDFLFISVKGYTNIRCVDSMSFRKINIRK